MKEENSVSEKEKSGSEQGRITFIGTMQNFAQKFYEEFIQAEREKEKAIQLIKYSR